MKVKELFNYLDTRFPPFIQENYDNSGKQVSFGNEEINGILLALDISEDVIDELEQRKYNVLVTHHPLLFKPLKHIDDELMQSRILLHLIDKRVSLYSAHTPLDKVYYDKLAKRLDVQVNDIIYKDEADIDGSEELGYGVLGKLQLKMGVEEFLSIVKTKLGIEYITYCGDEKNQVNNIALLNGAGGRKIPSIINTYDVDCIITGDVGYHEMKHALDTGVVVIDAGHYGTEKILLDFLSSDLQDFLTKSSPGYQVQVSISNSETNPFKVTM